MSAMGYYVRYVCMYVICFLAVSSEMVVLRSVAGGLSWKVDG